MGVWTRPALPARLAIALGLGLVLGLSGCSVAAPDPTMPVPPAGGELPQAESVGGVAAVGPLFPADLDSAHTCTGSVLDSPGKDLVLTAAHCVVGTGRGMIFVPGYDDGATPDGVFQVQRAWADPAWLTGTDPLHDYAILQVAERDSGSGVRLLQVVTGGFELSSAAPAAGIPVRVTGYLRGLRDSPVSCAPVLETADVYLGFRCGGFGTGTSGSPLVVAPDTVVGVIGGLHQGGCVEQVSYSSPLRNGARRLLDRAAGGAPGDTLPQPGGDGC